MPSYSWAPPPTWKELRYRSQAGTSQFIPHNSNGILCCALMAHLPVNLHMRWWASWGKQTLHFVHLFIPSIAWNSQFQAPSQHICSLKTCMHLFESSSGVFNGIIGPFALSFLFYFELHILLLKPIPLYRPTVLCPMQTGSPYSNKK